MGGMEPNALKQAMSIEGLVRWYMLEPKQMADNPAYRLQASPIAELCKFMP